MPTLPWTAPRNVEMQPTELTVMASRFQLHTWRDVPQFFLASMKIRRQMLNSAGNAGVSLVAKPIGKTFYTLSAWNDRDSLYATIGRQPHLAAMQRFRSRTEESLFAFWAVPAADPHPRWNDAFQRLDDEANKTPPD